MKQTPQKVRELSVDLQGKVNELTGKLPGFDFYLDAKENPGKIYKWIEATLKNNNVPFVKITVSRPILEEYVKITPKLNIENYIKHNLREEN